MALEAVPDYPKRVLAVGVVACFVASALALGVAPLLLPHDYHWIAHTTSEAAAQRVNGAWLARSGFLLFGLAVIWLASGARMLWGRWGTVFHTSFGLFMISAAVYSARSWNPAVPFDRTEDILHSAAATAMGFAFAFGVFSVLVLRTRHALKMRWLDVAAVAASVLIPLAMIVHQDLAGILQRGMFLIAYFWYGREAFLLFSLGGGCRSLGRRAAAD
jgi:hypothetical protein